MQMTRSGIKHGSRKYVIEGLAVDQFTPVGVVGRFTGDDRYQKDKTMYGYQCQYCEGTVRPKKIAHEAFKHKKGFVILEQVTIGVCDVCGNRYYSADILHTVHEIAAGERMPERTAAIPAVLAA